MRSSINLASPIVAEHHPVEKLLIVSVGIFILTFLFAGSLLGFLVYVRNQVSEMTAQETSLQQQINAVPQQKVNALILKNRLSDISKILASRQDINTKITAVTALLPPALNISSFSTDKEDIAVELTSSDLSVFDSLLENDVIKLQNTPNGSISKITVDSFQVQPENPQYTMRVLFNLK